MRKNHAIPASTPAVIECHGCRTFSVLPTCTGQGVGRPLLEKADQCSSGSRPDPQRREALLSGDWI